MTRKILSGAGIIAMALALCSIPAVSRTRTTTWTGWISDSGCGAKGMSASHKSCALACVHQKGQKFVLVTEDKQVHPISNQHAVKDSDVGEEVNISGRILADGSIQVKSISPTM